MAKIVYNGGFGRFGLSPAAVERYKQLRGSVPDRDLPRHDPTLVQVVEELGGKANGSYAFLRIAEIPDGTQYLIEEYDGAENVRTKESYDWQTA